MNTALHALIPELAGRRVLVLGDVMLDEYITGKAQRLSREAPIPVLEFQSRTLIPGGAANPASNIQSLGSTALQVGIVGDDPTAAQLRAALHARGMDSSGLVTVPEKPTTLKTRLLAQMGLRFPQQVARIDTLSRDPIAPDTIQEIIVRLQGLVPDVAAILVSDYHNGLLLPALIDATRQQTAHYGIPLIVDAQGQLQKYIGFDVLKCNADDAADYLRRELRSDLDYAQAAQDLLQQLQAKQGVIITRGADGATVVDQEGEVTHCPAPKVSNVYDTVGAGDTWIAVFTLARLAAASLVDASLLANVASGIVVQHVGNYTPSSQELLDALA